MMKAVKVRVGLNPEIVDIPNELHALQKEVGGYIETIPTPIGTDSAVIICNEEGRLLGLDPNRHAGNGLAFNDVIFGDFLIVGTDGEEFCGLTQKQAVSYCELYRRMK